MEPLKLLFNEIRSCLIFLILVNEVQRQTEFTSLNRLSDWLLVFFFLMERPKVLTGASFWLVNKGVLIFWMDCIFIQDTLFSFLRLFSAV